MSIVTQCTCGKEIYACTQKHEECPHKQWREILEKELTQKPQVKNRTMDNKELPQEIQDKIMYHSTTCQSNVEDRGACPKPCDHCIDYFNPIDKEFRRQLTQGAQIASEYYEPKLAEKDAKIKEQAEQIEKLKGLLKEEFYADCHSKKPFIQLIADEENKKYDEYVDGLWEEKCKQHGI